MDYDSDQKELMWKEITKAIQNDLLYERDQVINFLNGLLDADYCVTCYVLFVTDRQELTHLPFTGSSCEYPQEKVDTFGGNVIVVSTSDPIFKDILDYCKKLLEIYDL